MTPAEAAAHLLTKGWRLAPGPALSSAPGAEYLHCLFGDERVCLDGDFTATDLEAIAVWMRSQTAVAVEMERIHE